MRFVFRFRFRLCNKPLDFRVAGSVYLGVTLGLFRCPCRASGVLLRYEFGQFVLPSVCRKRLSAACASSQRFLLAGGSISIPLFLGGQYASEGVGIAARPLTLGDVGDPVRYQVDHFLTGFLNPVDGNTQRRPVNALGVRLIPSKRIPNRPAIHEAVGLGVGDDGDGRLSTVLQSVAAVVPWPLLR